LNKELNIRNHLIVALDFPTAHEALQTAVELRGLVDYLKVGKQLFTAAGPELVRKLISMDFKIFLDLKFHDIPNTAAAAAVEAVKLGVSIFNVHISGGRKMMQETVRQVESFTKESNKEKPLIIGVTVLTSLDDNDMQDLGISRSVMEQVEFLSRLGKEAGLDGVVSSAKEIPIIRRTCGDDFKIITPGIRPARAATDDQKRVVTPADALKMGADFLVIGRPITKAVDKADAVNRIMDDL
jgi:orotidine-5'-phosphate decarboxylase